MADKKIQPTKPAATTEAKTAEDRTETRKTAIKTRRSSARKANSFRGA